jgi:hypothetical protein
VRSVELKQSPFAGELPLENCPPFDRWPVVNNPALFTRCSFLPDDGFNKEDFFLFYSPRLLPHIDFWLELRKCA